MASMLVPGAHAIIMTDRESVALEGRQAGLGLRDTLLVLSHGPKSRFAFLFRKELDQPNVAKQMLDTNTSALNIGECRIHSGPSVGGSISGKSALGQDSGWNKHNNRTTEIDRTMAAGRWPPNVLLMHSPSCKRADAWQCVAGCPAKALDDQTGIRPSTLTGRADPTKTHTNPGDNNGASLFGGGNSVVYADSGGAARFYPQFGNEEELVEWLQRLIGPPV